MLFQVCCSLPTLYPITLESFNYAPVALVLVITLALAAWWCPRWGARLHFRGPQVSRRIMAAYKSSRSGLRE